MAEKGLGTGLMALLGNEALEEGSSDFEYIALSKIEPRREQPRNMFDDESLGELAESIAEHGVIQPLTVRRLDSGYYQIIAGERRWRAARMARLEEVPVRIIDADDRKTMELALVENLQRESLNPVEEAMGYRALMEEYGLTQEETAKRVSKSRPVIANALRLLNLPESALKYLKDGKLSPGAARAILSLGDSERMEEAAQAAVSREMSVREVEGYVKKLAAEKQKNRKKEKKGIVVDYYAEAGKTLSEELGRKVTVVNGREKGRIELEFYDEEDFEALFSALCSINKKRRYSE